MKNEFLIAITQLSAEKNLPKEVILSALEIALASAFKKDNPDLGPNLSVKVNPNTGEIVLYSHKTVVEDLSDPRGEITLPEARRINPAAKEGETVLVETTTKNAGRIAAQTAKQVVMQRLREAEREVVYEEFSDREGDIVSGVVQRIEPKQVILDLGKAEASLPMPEQVRAEHYRVGQRLKAYLVEVYRTNKGPQVIVSRTHRNLVRRLFEMEVPEIYNGTVEVKAIAREPGYRSKVAVAGRQEGIDPVGSCVGLRGIRIQNIINELNGEKIDVIHWDQDPKVFVANALSPAQVVKVEIDEAAKTASVVVPDRHLSLAIGKEGQNARLAAKLTGWRIDIKSITAAEAEEKAYQELLAEEAAEAEALAALETPPPEALTAAVEEAPSAVSTQVPAEIEEPTPLEPEAPEAAAKDLTLEEAAPTLSEEPKTATVVEEAPPQTRAPAEKPRIRLSEDIFGPVPDRGVLPRRDKEKEKGLKDNKDKVETPAKPKKARQPKYYEEEAEEEEYKEYLKPSQR